MQHLSVILIGHFDLCCSYLDIKAINCRTLILGRDVVSEL